MPILALGLLFGFDRTDQPAEQERANAAVKAWLLAEIEKKRDALPAALGETASDKPFVPGRLAA
jgi:hypothetical protein